MAPFRLKVAALAMLLVACVGWLFTGSLHRHLLACLKPPERGATSAGSAGKAAGSQSQAITGSQGGRPREPETSESGLARTANPSR